MNSQYRLAILFAILAPFSLAVTGVYTAKIVETGMFIPAYLGIRSLGCGVILILFMAMFQDWPTNILKYWKPILIGAVINGGISIGYLFSIAFIPVTIAVILIYTFPFFLAIYTALFAGKKLTPRRIILLALAFLGVSLAVGAEFSTLNGFGIALAVGGAILFAAYLVLTSSLPKDLKPMTFLAFSQVGAGALMSLALIPFIPLSAFAMPTAAIWPGLIVALGFIAGMGFQLLAVSRADPINLAVYFNLEPVLATGLSIIILNEVLTLPQYVGAGCVVLAVMLSALFDIQRAERDKI